MAAVTQPVTATEAQVTKVVEEQGQFLTAQDLMRLQLEDDPLMLELASLCTLCTHTCSGTC